MIPGLLKTHRFAIYARSPGRFDFEKGRLSKIGVGARSGIYIYIYTSVTVSLPVETFWEADGFVVENKLSIFLPPCSWRK